MDYSFLTGMIGVELRKTQILASRRFEREFGKDLLPGHYTVLVLIQNNEAKTQTALAEAAGIDRSSLVPVLKDFEKKGFIERQKSPTDARSKVTVLTEIGQNYIEQHRAKIIELENLMVNAIGSKKDCEKLNAALRKIQSAIS